MLKVFRISGHMRHAGEENVFPAEADPNPTTRKVLLRAKELLGGAGPDVRLYF